MRFAKLFDVGDDDQILITKSWDDRDQSELLVTTVKTEEGLTIDQKAGYDSKEERDAHFDGVDQERAEALYEGIKGFINLMGGADE
ncbi:MAG TPA: hypothetical protein VGB63_13205 [Pedobacter sp.]|jgi:hypothetical protein